MKRKKIIVRQRIIVSLLGGLIALVVSFPLTWQEIKSNTPREISYVEMNVEKLFQSKMDSALPPWKEVEEITKSLIFENERIAQAKALLHYKDNPLVKSSETSSNDYLSRFMMGTNSNTELWENRHQLSKQEWQIKTVTSKIFVTTGISVLVGIGAVLLVFLILTLVPWLWYFILERAAELSQSIQGKIDS